MRELLFRHTRPMRPWYTLIPILVLIAVSLWCLFFSLSFSLCRISGQSMENTLRDKQFVIIRSGDRGLSRGSLVVFDAGTEDHIKRVIGLGGDTLRLTVTDAAGDLTLERIEGGEAVPIAEPYIKDGTFTLKNPSPQSNVDEEHRAFVHRMHDELSANGTFEFTVPDGALFVLGDNRGNSYDSRDHGFVARESVVAVVSDKRESVALTLGSGRTKRIDIAQAFRVLRTLGLFFGYIGLASLFFASDALLFCGGRQS